MKNPTPKLLVKLVLQKENNTAKWTAKKHITQLKFCAPCAHFRKDAKETVFTRD
jgi:hypothetical protein